MKVELTFNGGVLGVGGLSWIRNRLYLEKAVISYMKWRGLSPPSAALCSFEGLFFIGKVDSYFACFATQFFRCFSLSTPLLLSYVVQNKFYGSIEVAKGGGPGLREWSWSCRSKRWAWQAGKLVGRLSNKLLVLSPPSSSMNYQTKTLWYHRSQSFYLEQGNFKQQHAWYTCPPTLIFNVTIDNVLA